MIVPKRRPPSPHSCSSSRSPRFQREATKPSTVTSAKKKRKTASAVQLTPPSLIARVPRLHVDDPGQQRADRDPEELVPVEEREAEEARLRLGVERRPEQEEVGQQEQEVPEAPPPGLRRSVAHRSTSPVRPPEQDRAPARPR